MMVLDTGVFEARTFMKAGLLVGVSTQDPAGRFDTILVPTSAKVKFKSLGRKLMSTVIPNV
jgi:hypothetical protein